MSFVARVFASASLALLLTAIAVAATASQAGGGSPKLAYLAGTVVREGTGEPIADAEVQLTLGGLSLESPSDAGVRIKFRGPLKTKTDLQGQFAFSDVALGTYRLRVDSPGFVRSYRPVTVRPGERLEGVRLAVIPTGSVGGQVFDENGAPIVAAAIHLVEISVRERRRELNVMRTSEQTDENGDYVLENLEPGEYALRAVPPSGLRSQETGLPYAAVYYPGVVDPALATTVELLPGATMSNADIRFNTIGTFRISGRVLNAAASGSSGRVATFYLVSRDTLVSLRSGMFGRTQPYFRNTLEDDPERFEIRNVPPGSYDLYPLWDSDGTKYTSRTTVHVVDRDIEDLTIAIPPGVTIQGRTTWLYDPGDAVNLSGVGWRLSPMVGASGLPFKRHSAQMKSNGSFVFGGVTPLDYRLGGNGLSGALRDGFLAGAFLDGVDVLGQTMQVGPDSSLLEIRIDGPSGNVAVNVHDADGDPVAGSWIRLVRVGFEEWNASPNALHGSHSGERRGR